MTKGAGSRAITGQIECARPASGRRDRGNGAPRQGFTRGPALDAEHGKWTAVELPAQRVGEPPDRSVVLEDEDVVARRDLRGEPLGVEMVEPGHVDDLETDASLGEHLGRGQRLVQHHRPVGEQDRVVALAQDGASTRSHARGIRELDPPGRRPDRRAGRRRSPPRPRPPSAEVPPSARCSPAARSSWREALRAARCRGATGVTSPARQE